jgi:phosphotransferase system  glucose/maltose/N-acetylglucosamine-specific IIC component
MADSDEIGTSAIEALRQTRRLPFRLKREIPWGRSIGCALFIGMSLTGVAIGVGYLVRRLPHDQSDTWVPYVFMGVFGFVGVCLIVSGIHQWFASRVRQTILEIDLEEIPLGSTVRACFRQEGPVTLNSLRANLRCIERRHTWKTRSNSDGDSTRYKTTDEKELWSENILDEEPGSVPAEEFWEKSVSFQIPGDRPASLDTDDLEIVWKIEIWGRVHRWPDFMHPFVINVV